MKTVNVAVLGVTLLAAGAMLAGSASAGDEPASRAAVVKPGHFEHPRCNPYFPLEPGTVYRYRGTDDGERYRESVRITDRTKNIQGVEAMVLRDVLRRADGSLAEKTHDWYAADKDGNVWYFGENTATYDEQGDVESTEGSWKAGAHGAVAGIIMPAHPRPTDAYRQEYYRGHAEDQAWIAQRGSSATVPYGHVTDVVRSFEWSRLEKDVMSEKLYAPGLGMIREKDLVGGTETFELVGVSHR